MSFDKLDCETVKWDMKNKLQISLIFSLQSIMSENTLFINFHSRTVKIDIIRVFFIYQLMHKTVAVQKY
jgi:hypothetical protein